MCACACACVRVHARVISSGLARKLGRIQSRVLYEIQEITPLKLHRPHLRHLEMQSLAALRSIPTPKLLEPILNTCCRNSRQVLLYKNIITQE